MEQNDIHPTTEPVLDYAVPSLHRARLLDAPVVRLTAGAAVPVLGLLIADGLAGEDLIFCDAIGSMVELLMIGGLFQICERPCRRIRGKRLVERHWALTVGAGLFATCLIYGVLAIAERAPKPVAITLCMLSVIGAPVGAPWDVFRDEQP